MHSYYSWLCSTWVSSHLCSQDMAAISLVTLGESKVWWSALIFLFLSHSPSKFPFSCLLLSFLFELVLSSSMCQCAVTFSRRALVFGAVKWTCVAWVAQMRCPHTLWPGQTLDIWCVLLALCQACILFSCALTHCALLIVLSVFCVCLLILFGNTVCVIKGWTKTEIFSC